VAIRSDAELDAAIQLVDSLLARGKSLTRSERARLNAVSDRIHEYERKHRPIRRLSPNELLGQLLAIHEASVASLAKATGLPQGILARILRGKRPIGRDEARKLAKHFGLKDSAFGGRNAAP
jgi:antitoxin component HigA of HigAB toxin-antitoxin module